MDSDKIQKFIFAHAEKAVVAIVLLASGWMIYSGMQMESVLEKHDPERLESDARQVLMSIDEDHNAMVLKDREPSFDIVAETINKRKPIDPSPYSLPNLLERRPIDTSIRRDDPQLAAPAKVRVSGQFAMVAMLSSSGNYPLQDLEGAEPLEKVEKKPKPGSNRGRRSNGRGGDMDGMGMGMDMGGMDGMGMGMDMGGMDDMGMGMGMDMGGSMMGGPGGMGGSASPAGRTFGADGDFGVRPTAKDGKKPVPRPGWFIAGTAVVPHAEIAAAFKTALADADGYSPLRDQPLYYNYEVQRGDVTDKDVGELGDDDWVTVRDREKDLIRAATQWAGFAKELVPEDFRDAQLTAYVPPVLLRDYSKFSLHPDIPMIGRREAELEEMKNIKDEGQNFDADDFQLAGPGQGGGGMGGMGNMGGMSGGPGFMGGGSGGMDMFGDSSMGMGMGMGMYGGMNRVEEDPVDYKIMRFFDFASNRDKNSPRPGRKYVYRVRYGIVDPNFPANPLQQPKVSTLSREVYQRVQQLMIKAEESDKRDFQRWSDWSEPSEPVALPPLNEYYAGPVEKPRERMIQIGDKQVPMSRDVPEAKMVSHALNMQHIATMPIWLEKVVPGSTMSFEGEAEAIDPIELKVKKVPETKVLSQSTVIAIDGGEPLGIENVDEVELNSPGLMLMFDESGKLRVTGEVQDQEPYRIYSFAKERGL